MAPPNDTNSFSSTEVAVNRPRESHLEAGGLVFSKTHGTAIYLCTTVLSRDPTKVRCRIHLFLDPDREDRYETVPRLDLLRPMGRVKLIEAFEALNGRGKTFSVSSPNDIAEALKSGDIALLGALVRRLHGMSHGTSPILGNQYATARNHIAGALAMYITMRKRPPIERKFASMAPFLDLARKQVVASVLGLLDGPDKFLTLGGNIDSLLTRSKAAISFARRPIEGGRSRQSDEENARVVMDPDAPLPAVSDRATPPPAEGPTIYYYQTMERPAPQSTHNPGPSPGYALWKRHPHHYAIRPSLPPQKPKGEDLG